MNKSIRTAKSRVESLVRTVDSGVIIRGLFHDEASNRLFLSLTRGPRRIEVLLPINELEDGNYERARRRIETGLKRLAEAPIG